jgi:signal transduction histidine kinase
VTERVPPQGAAPEGGVRRELARELHDLVVQELTATLVGLESFKRRPYDERLVVREVDHVQGSLRQALLELRHLLYDLRGQEGWHPGFIDSLREFVDRYTARTGITINLATGAEWPSRIPSSPAKHLQRIIHEAIYDAHLHRRARTIWVSLRLDGEVLRVTVLDDGGGLVLDEIESPGIGMLGMQERALLLGGSITVARAPEGGTMVRLDVPLAAIA